MPQIRVLLVDDHTVVREALARMLAEHSDVEVQHCGTVHEAVELLRKQPVDVLVLDYDLGPSRAPDLLGRCRDFNFSGRVLILSAFVNDVAVRQLLGAGVVGVLSKSGSAENLVGAIRHVHAGGEWIDAQFRAVAESVDEEHPELTAKEWSTLLDVVDGLTNKEIAAKYGITESGAKAVLQRLFRKTGASTRSQLVRMAIEHGFDLPRAADATRETGP